MHRKRANKDITKEDVELWSAFCNGDEKSFSILYRKYYHILYTYGISLGMASHQVRDTIQDLFLKLYTKPGLVQTAQTLRPFLFQSIKNQLIDLVRKGERFMDIEIPLTDFSFSYRIDDEFLEKERQEIIKQKIDHLLSQLTPRQKEITYLRFIHEMDYEEIAMIMNITQQGARNLLHKAMEKMRESGTDISYLIFLLTSFCKV